MFSYLKGKIIYKGENSVIVEANNFGFRVLVDETQRQKLEINDTAEFFIFEYLREEQREFYGFKTPEELEFAFTLVEVPGIGPRLAQKIISHAELPEIKKAIIEGDLKFLTEVSRIGQKTAEKLVLELQGKLEKKSKSKIKDPELEETLKKLGYSKEEILYALKNFSADENASDEVKLKAVLKVLKR